MKFVCSLWLLTIVLMLVLMKSTLATENGKEISSIQNSVSEQDSDLNGGLSKVRTKRQFCSDAFCRARCQRIGRGKGSCVRGNCRCQK